MHFSAGWSNNQRKQVLPRSCTLYQACHAILLAALKAQRIIKALFKGKPDNPADIGRDSRKKRLRRSAFLSCPAMAGVGTAWPGLPGSFLKHA
ncbi:hypothetical protein [Aquitalea sp. ASV15]|uniref:hypothetical protein n=1 Tax=Aquitalea sp. ASV15 TaxID=2795104 RepID=UPI0018ED1201|nr:hypothetical protein [Aquitalea sp. ASV15]